MFNLLKILPLVLLYHLIFANCDFTVRTVWSTFWKTNVNTPRSLDEKCWPLSFFWLPVVWPFKRQPLRHQVQRSPKLVTHLLEVRKVKRSQETAPQRKYRTTAIPPCATKNSNMWLATHQS